MDPITISALIAGGSSLLGGFLNSNNQAKLQQQNLAQQLNFAQNSVSWRAADATKAEQQYGINRLALLGVPGASFQNLVGDNSMGAGVADMGQNIARAMSAYKSPEERALMASQQALDLEKQQLQVDILKTELASKVRGLAAPGTPPPVVAAIPKPPPSHAVDVKVAEPEFTPYQTIGGVPLISHPGYTNAQTGEDRSGEFVGDVVGGMLGFPADVSYSVDRMLRLRGYKSRPYNIPDAIARYGMSKNPYKLPNWKGW